MYSALRAVRIATSYNRYKKYIHNLLELWNIY